MRLTIIHYYANVNSRARCPRKRSIASRLSSKFLSMATWKKAQVLNYMHARALITIIKQACSPVLKRTRSTTSPSMPKSSLLSAHSLLKFLAVYCYKRMCLTTSFYGIAFCWTKRDRQLRPRQLERDYSEYSPEDDQKKTWTSTGLELRPTALKNDIFSQQVRTLSI